jgi:hypothetical protein
MAEDGFDLTIHGLLRKRTALIASVEDYRNKLAATLNDINAIDRVLQTLGYQGERDLAQPRKRVMSYMRHEVRRYILDQLRDAGRPLTTRELAVKLAVAEGKDANDRGLMNDLSKRVSKSLMVLHDKQVVRRVKSREGRLEYQYELA